MALPGRAVLAAAVVYAHGQNLDADEPMRRIPPLHGRVALRFSPARPAFAEVEWLWAAKQDRLASGDLADHRIAPGGTPGWNVLNLRAVLGRRAPTPSGGPREPLRRGLPDPRLRDRRRRPRRVGARSRRF